MNEHADNDPRLHAIPDIHGHAKGEHKAFADERPIPLSARMLFLWFYHACRRGWPRFLMVTDHMNYLTFEDPAAINLVRRALKLAQAGDLYGAAETASVEVGHAAVVSEGLRRGMRYSIGAEVDNDPRSRPDAQNIVDAMKPDGMIRSVHFLTIDHPTHGPNWNWPFDNPEFADVFEIVGTEKTWELYMATLLDAVERLPGNIVGHFYVPAIFGHWPDEATLERYEDQIVDACADRGMALELNTRYLYRDHPDAEKVKYLAAYRRLLRKCKAKNVGVAVGSDAHSPKDQGRSFDVVLALLDECEINELVFPLAGRLARVALRVERKTEPAAPETPAVTADERKAVRKPRTSEAPARPKETSPKRDDTMLDADPQSASDADAGPAKGKAPRPKRSKSSAASSGEPAGDAGGAEPSVTDGIGDGVTVAVGGESAENAITATPPEGVPAVSADEPEIVEAAAVTISPDAQLVTEEQVFTQADVLTEEDVLTDADIVTGSAIVTSPESAIEEDEAAPYLDEIGPVDVAVNGATTGETQPPVVPAGVTTKPPRPRAPAAKAKPGTPNGKIKASASKPKSGAKKTKPAPRGSGKSSASAKKTAAKKAAPKKAAAKKVPSKKAVVKKAPVKKVAARTPAKKAGAKKSTAKKAGSKKPTPKRR